MKIDELIKELETVREEHGNLEVEVFKYGMWAELEEFTSIRDFDNKLRL